MIARQSRCTRAPHSRGREPHRTRRIAQAKLLDAHAKQPRKKEMADLMHQDMLDDGAKRLVVLGPIIENWAPVEPDHVRHLNGCALGTERQADALKQAKQVELAVRLHLVEDVLARKIIHSDDHIGGEVTKPLRQMLEDFAGQGFKFGQRRRLNGMPSDRIGCEIGHNLIISSLRGLKRLSNPLPGSELDCFAALAMTGKMTTG